MTGSVKLLYLSSTEWGNLGRRKVRLGYEFARQDDVAAALFVNPPVTTSVLDLARGRFPSSHLGDDRQAHADAVWGCAKRLDDKLWLYTGTTKTIPLTKSERLRRSRWLNRLNYNFYAAGLRRQLRRMAGDELVVWLSHPLHIFALDYFPERRLACYDWTDDWTAFSQLPVADRTALERASDRALHQADLVFTVSESLRQRASAINRRTHPAPNATDFDLLSQSAHTATPAAPELHALASPCLGYIGQIGENIDYALVGALAEARPAWSFVFVGPVWATRQAEVERLSAFSNVHFVGGRPHALLPGYLRGFDVCLMPHLRNALTTSMDPTKLYDYLASGKPIVSTRVAGTERFADLVHFGDTPHEFLTRVEAALSENGTQAQARLAAAQENSWPRRAAAMWRVVTEACCSK
jgi:glycosyltransferase involved in cell wall biosynthesis